MTTSPQTRQTLNNREILRAAVVVLVGFLASGILGLVRAAVFSGTFGASAELDTFYSAQQIPELLFTLVAGGALGSSFIPVFARLRADQDLNGAWRLASAVLTLAVGAALVFGLLLIVFAPVYMPLLLPDAAPAQLELAIRLTQIMMVTTVIFAASGLLMGILNAHQVFLLPALAMSMNNLGLIFGGLVLAHIIPTESGLFTYESSTSANIYGLALGAILGATLHLVVQLPGLWKIRARLRFLPHPRIKGVGEVLKLMLPRVFGLGVARLNFIVSLYFAGLMLTGSYTALNTAWFLTFFVLGIIAQSAGTAIFPTLAALAANGDLDGFKDRLAVTVRAVLFLALPASLLLILLGEPIIALLLQRGEWTGEATAAAAWGLAFYAIGIAGHALLELLSRAFYALSDTRTPVLIGVISLVMNIILSAVFITFIGDPNSLARGPFAGLALSNSVTTLVEGAVLWWLLHRRLKGMHSAAVLVSTGRTGLAALVMAAAVYMVMQFTAQAAILVTLLASGATAALTFFGAALLLRVEEARTIPALVLRRFKR